MSFACWAASSCCYASDSRLVDAAVAVSWWGVDALIRFMVRWVFPTGPWTIGWGTTARFILLCSGEESVGWTSCVVRRCHLDTLLASR